jgi:hypothetical protein
VGTTAAIIFSIMPLIRARIYLPRPRQGSRLLPIMHRFWKFLKAHYRAYDLLSDYLRSIKHAGWDVIWAPLLPSIAYWLLWFRPNPPAWWVTLIYAVWVVIISSYFIWRPLHVRLTPQFDVRKLIPMPTETETKREMNMFIQIVPECLSDAPVLECSGRLLRVCKRHSDDEEWAVTNLNAPMYLGWDYYGCDPLTIHKGIEQRLNVCYWSSAHLFILPAITPMPSKVRVIFNSTGTFKFDIRITAKECEPVDVAVTVNLDSREWDKPVLKLIKGGHSVHEPTGIIRISEV